VIKKRECNETVHRLFMDFKKACDSVTHRREVLYDILIEFRVSIKFLILRLNKICSNETYTKVYIGKYLPDKFPFPDGLKQGGALLLLLFNFA
jgi:hypothetical protein